MNKIRSTIILLTSVIAGLVTSTLAQDEGLTLRLSRDFGYSSGTGRIQGTFSMKVSGPASLERVSFLIDEQVVFEDTEAPFQFQFHTDNFSVGVHNLSAIGYTSDGAMLKSDQQLREFVSAEESWQDVGKIVLPIFGIIGAFIAFSFLIPFVFDRRNKHPVPAGTQRNYGLLGGTICPKCNRPFAMHAYGLNLAVGKLDCCPHCRRWSLVRRTPLSTLRAAEQAELEQAKAGFPSQPLSAEENFQRELEDSRYQDL